MNKLIFANIRFTGLTKKDIFIETNELKFIITVNAEFIVKANENKEFLEILNSAMCTFDGQVPYLIAKKKNPNIYIEKLSGSDLIYDFANFAKIKNKRIFLLGGLEDSNKIAIEKLKEKYNISINGFSPEYKPFPFEKEHNDSIIKVISQFKPDILFVGFGALKQESWINLNKKELSEIGIKWVIGSGGTFEFVSGKIKRAPKVIQKIGLEGVFRFLKEPKFFRFYRLLQSLKIFKYV